jgi:hypothetical protein
LDDTFEERIRDIKRRIEELRGRLHSSQPRTTPRTDNVERQVQDVGQSAKEKELDDIRKKLRPRA